MSTNSDALSSGGGGGGLISDEEEEEVDVDEISVPDEWGHRLEDEQPSSSSDDDSDRSSDSTDDEDNIVKSPSGTCVNSVTGEVVDCDTGEPLFSPDSGGDSGSDGDTDGGDRPEPGDPDWSQADVKPEGGLSIVRNIDPGEGLSPRIMVRGDGPVGETAEATYRVEVPKAGLSKSITVTINGGKSRWVHLEGLGSISEPGRYEAVLYGDGERLEKQTYLVGGAANSPRTFDEEPSGSGSDGDSSTSSSSDDSDSSGSTPRTDTEPPETGMEQTDPPARPTGGPTFPGNIDLGLDTDQLLVGALALLAVGALVVRA